MQWEHLVPVSKGGLFIEGNIVVSCSKCNQSKGTKTAENYLRQRFVNGQSLFDQNKEVKPRAIDGFTFEQSARLMAILILLPLREKISRRYLDATDEEVEHYGTLDLDIMSPVNKYSAVNSTTKQEQKDIIYKLAKLNTEPDLELRKDLDSIELNDLLTMVANNTCAIKPDKLGRKMPTSLRNLILFDINAQFWADVYSNSSNNDLNNILPLYINNFNKLMGNVYIGDLAPRLILFYLSIVEAQLNDITDSGIYPVSHTIKETLVKPLYVYG